MKTRTMSILILLLALVLPTIPSAEHALSGANVFTLHAAGRGNPWLNIQDAADLPTVYQGQVVLAGSLQAGAAQPRSLASADFDQDGMPDVLGGYATSDGGILTLHRGNVDHLWPNTPEAQQRRAAGTFVDAPFFPEAPVFSLPVAPDFLGAGDFDADGFPDVVAAALGGEVLILLPGDEQGGFGETQSIPLPGKLTALTVGEINRRDGLEDVIAGVEATDGPAVLVYESSVGALRAEPEVIPAPAPVTALALDQLDDHYAFDLAVAAGKHLLLVHGRDRYPVQVPSQPVDVPPATVDTIPLPFHATALATGDFRPEEGHQRELALLVADGTIHILDPTTLQEITQLSNFQSPISNLQLVRTRVSTSKTDDLVIIDPTNHQLHILPTSPIPNIKYPISTPATLDLSGAPAAVLPLRLNGDALNDLVILKEGGLTVGLTAPLHWFEVDSTWNHVDAYPGDCKCEDNVWGECTLWAAIEEAAYCAGPDRVSFVDDITTISPTSILHYVDDATTIEGHSLVRDRVEIDGSLAGDEAVGLLLYGDDCVVRNMVINRFQSSTDYGGIGILISGDNNTVEGSYIGTNTNGDLDEGNRWSGIAIGSGVVDTTIGWPYNPSSPKGNVISGNGGHGVQVVESGGSNIVGGNYIGTDATGQEAIRNTGVGVLIHDSPGTYVQHNIVSGNFQGGVGIQSGSRNTFVLNNYIGTDVDGMEAIPNGMHLSSPVAGVFIVDSSDNLIGWQAGTGNLISGNYDHGVVIGASGSHATTEPGNAASPSLDLTGWTMIPPTFWQAGAVAATGATGATGNVVGNNIIGLDINSFNKLPNYQDGVRLLGVSGNEIGRVFNGERWGNTIAGNRGRGIYLDHADDNSVVANYIGTCSGIVNYIDLGNFGGVQIAKGNRNVIGGLDDQAYNVIVSNDEYGVKLHWAHNNLVQRNYIGTNVAFEPHLGNGDGVLVTGFGNQIGGGGDFRSGNYIAGNERCGIRLVEAGENRVQGNWIGVNEDGTKSLGNHTGIEIIRSYENLIGGIYWETRKENTIAHNKEGILVFGGDRNQLHGNESFGNELGGGVDLLGDGPTFNDPLDADTGPNDLQNYPAVAAATLQGSITLIEGVLDSKPNTTYWIEIFTADDCLASQMGEGKEYLGFDNVTTDGAGHAEFSFIYSGYLGGLVVTATATDPEGNTSEYSPGLVVGDSTELWSCILDSLIDPGAESTLTFTDAQGNDTTVQVPAGAVAESTTLVYTPLASPSQPLTGKLGRNPLQDEPSISQSTDPQFAGHGFALEAYRDGVHQPGLVFSAPMTVTIEYSDADVFALNEDSLRLHYWYSDTNEWLDAAATCAPPSAYDRHPDENWLAVPICHLSEFALLGEAVPGWSRVHLPLVVRQFAYDSTLRWHTFLGGADYDNGMDIALDGGGHLYVSGTSWATWGSPVNPHQGDIDGFVARLDDSGALKWNTFIGGEYGDHVAGVAADGSGNVYVAGSIVTIPDPVWEFYYYVAKLDSNGILQWKTSLQNDGASDVAVDESGNVYVIGTSGTGGAGSTGDIHVAKLNNDGVLLWNTFLGASFSDDWGRAIALDGSGNVYVAGDSEDPWGAPVNPHTEEGDDAFVAKLDSNGALLWNTFLGSSHDDWGSDLATDGNGEVYVVGHSRNTWGAPIDPYTPTTGGTRTYDAWVAKLNRSGVLQWNTFMGSSDDDYGNGIALDGSGRVHVNGESEATWGSPANSYAGENDAFVTILDGDGARLWNTFLGSPGAKDSGTGIAVDEGGREYVTGSSEAAWGKPLRPFAGERDAFVTVLQPQMTPELAAAPGVTPVQATTPETGPINEELPKSVPLGEWQYELPGEPLAPAAPEGRPLAEGFESGAMPPPGGWLVSGVHPTSTWTIVDALTYPDFVYTGDYAAWVDRDDAAASDEWLRSPAIDLTGILSATLDFWALSNTYGVCPDNGAGANMLLHVTDSGGTPIATVWDMCEDEYWSSWAWRRVTVDLSPYQDQTIRLAWQYAGIAGNSFGLDNVSLTGSGGAPDVELVPGYQKDRGVAGEVVHYDVTLWNFTNQADSFDVAYSGHAWDVSGPSQVGPVADYGAYVFQVDVTLPAAACPAGDTVVVQAQAQANPAAADTATLETRWGEGWQNESIDGAQGAHWMASTCTDEEGAQGTCFYFGGLGPNNELTAYAQKYDVATGTWIRLADMPTPVFGTAAGYIDGKVYVVGGFTGTAGSWPVTGTLQIYDVISDTWSLGPDLPIPRGGGAGGAVGGKFYLAAGQDKTSSHRHLHEYDPATDQWSEKEPAPDFFHLGAGVASADRLYVGGGYNGEQGFFEYDPGSDTWQQRAFLPGHAGKKSPVMAVAPDCSGVFLYGGDLGDWGGIQNTTWYWDLNTDTWSNYGAHMYRASTGAGGGFAGGRLWTFGGSIVAGPSDPPPHESLTYCCPSASPTVHTVYLPLVVKDD